MEIGYYTDMQRLRIEERLAGLFILCKYVL